MVAQIRKALNGHSKHVFGGLALTMLCYLVGDAYRDIRAKADRIPGLIEQVNDGFIMAKEVQHIVTESVNTRLEDNRRYNEGEWSNQRAWNSGFGQDIRDGRRDQKEILDLLRETASEVKALKNKP